MGWIVISPGYLLARTNKGRNTNDLQRFRITILSPSDLRFRGLVLSMRVTRIRELANRAILNQLLCCITILFAVKSSIGKFYTTVCLFRYFLWISIHVQLLNIFLEEKQLGTFSMPLA